MSNLGSKQIIAKNIKKLMEVNNVSQTDICNALNFKPSTFSDWANAKTYPRIDKIEMLANYFGVEKSDLIEDSSAINTQFDNIYKIDKIKLPMLGTIACGEPIFTDEDRESYVMVGTEIRDDFCLKCQGDSMINARIHDGDIVFIRKQDIVDNGEIAAVIIDDEATLKRFYYYKEQNMVILRPENSKYKDIILTGEQLERVKVLGKAVAFQSDVE